MAQSVEIETGLPMVEEDRADTVNGNGRKPYDAAMATDPDVVVYRISGAFFFGAAAAVAAALERLAEHPKAYVIDFSSVPVIDSTGATTIEGFVRKAHRHGAAVYIAGARRPVRRVLLMHGVGRPRVQYKAALGDAMTAAHSKIDLSEPSNEMMGA
jgi:SulP family sulfate permease